GRAGPGWCFHHRGGRVVGAAATDHRPHRLSNRVSVRGARPGPSSAGGGKAGPVRRTSTHPEAPHPHPPPDPPHRGEGHGAGTTPMTPTWGSGVGGFLFLMSGITLFPHLREIFLHPP